MDRIINVKVGGNHLSKDNKNAGVRGEANVTKLRITFDGGWDEYAKKVTFWDARGANPVERTLTADLLENIVESTRVYLVPIPAEPMAEAGNMTFVIDGYIDSKRQRSMSDVLVVQDAPIADNAGEPADPTPSQAEQLQGQIDTILDNIQIAQAGAETARDEAQTSEQISKNYAEESATKAQEAQRYSEAAQGYRDNALEHANTAKGAADKAETAITHEPIITDGNWHVWNAQIEQYEDTGVKAQAGSTVYCGYNPPDDADVWINPDGEGIDVAGKEDKENKVDDIYSLLPGDELVCYPSVQAIKEYCECVYNKAGIGFIDHVEHLTADEYLNAPLTVAFVRKEIGALNNSFEQRIDTIDEQTEIIKSDVEGLQQRINEEAHFRGYLSTNAKIKALTATPNDFAYSAESGTKWVYDANNGWVDTGTPVPDQLTPASETTPLINGVASVGTENAYARGDHRHPTDTTRVSVEEFNALKSELETGLDNIITIQNALIGGGSV